jgi:DNA-binding HxlR family transcriptional regulator
VAKHGAMPRDRGGEKDAHATDGGGVQSRKLGAIRGQATAPEGGRPDVDRLIHEPMRLGIVSALAASETLTFNDLKRLMATTDGNLSVHARKLEDAGYVACTKSFDGRVPRTEYRLTTAGRRALERYVDHMEALIKAMRGA